MPLRTKWFFRRMKRATHGMMHTGTYRALYRHALSAPPGDMLEVGAGHGASTIALALALADSGREGRVFTIEKCEGGSRASYGSKADNLEILRGNLSRYGVADRVEIIDETLSYESASGAVTRPVPGTLGLMLMDADGEIYRDLSLFYGSLVAGAVVVIDDCPVDEIPLERSAETPRLRKMRKTQIFARHFLDSGLLEPVTRSYDTLFTRRPGGVGEPPAFDPEQESALRRLIERPA